MVFPWRFQEARKLHLWVQMVPENGADPDYDPELYQLGFWYMQLPSVCFPIQAAFTFV